MNITAFDLAQRYVGIREFSEQGQDHPLIQWWFSLCGWSIDTPDEVPWCSVFVNGIAWELRLPRSKSAAARSWLGVGTPVSDPTHEPMVGFDVVVLQRGSGAQPGPEVLDAPGHVGFFAGFDMGRVMVLGGNQGNAVSVASFPATRVLGYRRLYTDEVG